MHSRTSVFSFLVLAAACAAPGVDIVPQPTDFAVVAIQLEVLAETTNCWGSSSSSRAGSALTGRSTWTASCASASNGRCLIDLKAIAEGVIKNNMGVGGITLQVRVQGATATFADTAQKLPVTNAPSASTKPWQVFTTEGWGEGETLSLAWVAESDAPSADRQVAAR